MSFFFFLNKCLNIVFNHRNQILRQLSSHSCRIKMELLAGRRGAGDARAQQRKSPRNANFPGISPARHCPSPCSIPLRLGGPDHRHLEAPQAPQPTQTHACPLVLTMKAQSCADLCGQGQGKPPSPETSPPDQTRALRSETDFNHAITQCFSQCRCRARLSF